MMKKVQFSLNGTCVPNKPVVCRLYEKMLFQVGKLQEPPKSAGSTAGSAVNSLGFEPAEQTHQLNSLSKWFGFSQQ
ncbi:hypothetical protein TIFTF001_027453 [Ficus carica]|uniref:Uncharacterized protein n=1 Tax=Ficus carica TaxID=3494 RepID=A0AA88DP91_FICCA|nr:hypothetical protein TIFTF001_027453 [Ficus carica]